MAPKKPTSKKPAPAPVDPKKAPPAKEPTGPIWEKKPKNFAIGGDMQVILKAKQANSLIHMTISPVASSRTGSPTGTFFEPTDGGGAVEGSSGSRTS